MNFDNLIYALTSNKSIIFYLFVKFPILSQLKQEYTMYKLES